MFLKAFIATLVAFLVVDVVWIGLVARKIYAAELGSLMRETPGVVAAGLFYVVYAAGIVHLAVQPSAAAGTIKIALVNGAVLGALAYGTFTVTNYAILKDWSVTLVISDVLWGIAITALSAAAGYYAIRS